MSLGCLSSEDRRRLATLYFAGLDSGDMAEFWRALAAARGGEAEQHPKTP
jgi:hypothetical protein